MFKHYKHVNVGYWNIHSLVEKVNNTCTAFNKLSDDDFNRVIKRMDLFCLSETHVGPGFNIVFDNYHTYKSCRKISSNNRFYGGLCVFTSNSIKKGVKIIRNNHQGIIWLKLEKEFFKLDKDLYVCFTYISPSNSSYHRKNDFDSESIFDLIKQDSVEFMIKGNVIIMADFNAHVPINALDYIADDDLDSHIPLPNNVYSPEVPLARNTMELKELNQNGKSLIEMCKSMSVRILNGRVAGDNCGKFTRFPIYERANEEPNVTDYALSDTEFLSKIKYFSVSDLTRFFDHCSILLSFQANFSVDDIDTNNSSQSFAPPKLIWKSHYKLPLENVFKSENCQSDLNLFCNQIYNNDQSWLLCNSVI